MPKAPRRTSMEQFVEDGTKASWYRVLQQHQTHTTITLQNVQLEDLLEETCISLILSRYFYTKQADFGLY